MVTEAFNAQVRKTVEQLQDDFALAVSDIARYEDFMPRWSLERSMRGDRDFTPYEAEQVNLLCSEVRELVASFPEEFPLNLKDHQAIKQLLRRRKEQKEQVAFLQKQAQRQAECMQIINQS